VVVVWLVVALAGFAAHTNGFYPVREWLIFFWARAWIAGLAFGLASLAIGVKVLVLLRVRTGQILERFTLATALGVLTFALGVYVAGLLGLLGGAFFILWPLLLLLVGGPALLADFRRISRHLRRLGSKLLLPQSVVQALAALLTLASVFILYLHVIPPSGVIFDARWYHLPIAESYAAAGRIRPFAEGWYLGAYPHLASLLYTWAFLAPGELSHHVCLAVHLEFVLLLGTAVGVSALAARLLSGARLRNGGAALFLFPCVFLPDSNLNGGADDVLAFWAAPLGLALLRYLAAAEWGDAVLLGALLGAAGLTKYQAIYSLVAIALVLAVDLLRRRRFKPLLLAAATALVVSSPHWLKNWIAYGDPLYPNLHRWLPAHPFFRGAGAWLERYYWLNGSDPSHGAAQKLRGLWRGVSSFSFLPHGWAATSGGRPFFGSLFTLLLPMVLCVRPRQRVLVLVGCVHVGLAVWYFTYTYDRFLQAILPWMAACTAAIIAALWRTGRPTVRLATALLVGFQLVWGADVHFVGGSALKALFDHIAAGDAKTVARSAYPGVDLQTIGAKLHSASAKLVGHDFYQSLGVGVQVICDNPAWQGSIDYLLLDTPERTANRWRQLGATHVLWPLQKEERAAEDLARDAVFARAAVAFTRSPFTAAGYRVAELVRRKSPAREQPTRIAWLGCGSERALGVYTSSGLALGTVDRPLTAPDLTRDASAALADVNAVWSRSSCADTRAARDVLSKQFTDVLRSGDAALAIRQAP
jgi:hypothetical protein